MFMRTSMLLVLLLTALPARADKLVLIDPTGDDNGPGSYTYPTAPEYKPGSFDVTKVEISDKGEKVKIKLHLAARVEDPWKSRDWPVRGNGFSLQMAFLFVDRDHKKGSGHTEGIPGLNVNFAPESAWDKVVIISPQGNTRLQSEIQQKAKKLAPDIVLPLKVKASGKKIIATVAKRDLGQPQAGWGWQLIMQSNEGYPAKGDLLTRKVNQTGGPHRFGGGRDDDCDPHVIDLLAGSARGNKQEIELQHQMLSAYSCGKPAVLRLVYR